MAETITADTDATIAEWIGRTETASDTLSAQPARFMQATLGRESDLQSGDLLPPLWHWLYFLEARPATELGRDGHPRKGGFLPPVSLPRRMWAGGRFEFHAPLRLGELVRKVSTIANVAPKRGRTGQLCFVTVRHEIFVGDLLALTEEHDIVYREDPAPDAAPQAVQKVPPGAEIRETTQLTEVLLFRYSALTFNGHRIHYDIDYARDVEGYEGLVVHGPLIATLLVDLAVRTVGRQPGRFSFRALAPITADDSFDIEARRDGTTLHLWARRHDDVLAMAAEAEYDPQLDDPGWCTGCTAEASETTASTARKERQ